MQLHNSLNNEKIPLKKKNINIYSCGPTVYDHVHIGNLAAFIYADTLKRALAVNGIEVNHAMNFTDVDDKTIKASHKYKKLDKLAALKKLTREYEESFLADLESLGFDLDSYEFVRATDSIENMQDMIKSILEQGNAYVADDGIYFDINNYVKKNTYGKLTKITAESTGAARVNNDEYDKDNIHDFALWKFAKEDEPAWDFEIDQKNHRGRPGWHIECSAMSKKVLNLPFDIHTGGIDLKFPHHENEVAQALGAGEKSFCNIFMHNEHLLVEGEKMSKSKNNFFTLKDIVEKGYSAMIFRLLVLKGHYRKSTNFSFNELDSTANLLKKLKSIAQLRHQKGSINFDYESFNKQIIEDIGDDLNTPKLLSSIAKLDPLLEGGAEDTEQLTETITLVDSILGIKLIDSTPDISAESKSLIEDREQARSDKDFAKSDQIRDKLAKENILLKDFQGITIWSKN